ncbi:uncharacterized protein BDZ99DRAFT_522530 [Mytilinidion resinicola]|uniref:DUF3176 domain containing protein n=1 Tax=Mytilinidion resinicola TaxID=574789 RepID=A0A6A6YHB6_9PEZI|nr:uncharacterized protein BDZ99DRAFT_522530 [Mytilinidion resinicola]KAF2807923.1 hypothetical protein BDZ99DRAFT_522530 [Mytilinidion resinicola]
MEGGPPRLIRAKTTVVDRVLTDWWWWELFSWLVSFFATAAILVVLLLRSEQPLPHWPLGLSINAYISILAAIAKAALILPVSEAIGQLKWVWFKKESKLMDFFTFDSASRGPWGSLMLIWTTKCKHLATLGAVITILALAFETMFQQIVAYPERAVIVGNSSVAVARSFHVQPRWGGSIHDAPSLISDPQTSMFISTAIYSNSNDTFTPPPSNCPSGNCSWPTYSSLAVCNQCKDVTNLLYYQCRNYTIVDYVADNASNTNKACGWLLNNTLMVGKDDLGSIEEHSYHYLSMLAVSMPSDPSSDKKWNSTLFQDVAYPLLDLYVAFIPGGPEAAKRNDTPVMLECLMSWCVQSYQGIHEGGVLNETRVSTYLDPTTTRVSEADMLAGKQPVTLSPSDVNGTFTVSNSTTEAVRQQLAFGGTAGLTPTDFSDHEGEFETYGNGLFNFVFQPPYDIVPYLDNIAAAMTNSVRRKDNGTELVRGSAWAPQTFVQIRWIWILLPALLLIFSFVFLVGTIVKSTRQNVAVWKTSALAILLHGLSGDARHMLDPETPASEVEATAQRVQVVLSSEKDASKLVLV